MDRYFNANVAGIAYAVAGRFKQTLKTELGARLGCSVKAEAARTDLRVTLSWRRNAEIGGNDILATFEDAPGYVFPLPNGEFRHDHQMMIGAAVDILGDKFWSVSARFEADALNGLNGNAGVLELRINQRLFG